MTYFSELHKKIRRAPTVAVTFRNEYGNTKVLKAPAIQPAVIVLDKYADLWSMDRTDLEFVHKQEEVALSMRASEIQTTRRDPRTFVYVTWKKGKM